MLAEFALTPSIFEEEAHPDPDVWRDQLRELGHGMFPRGDAWPIMVSNLYEGSWHVLALQIVKAIKDQRARQLCQGILDNAAKTLVPRPAIDPDWPSDELAWGREAIASNGVAPIDRIIASSKAHEVLLKECRFIRCIDEVLSSGFWRGPWENSSPPMRILDQVQTLRKLCIHSDFLCLLTPHIYGGSDDETDFAIEVIRSTFARPVGFHAPEIEIHTEAFEPNPTAADFAPKLARLVNAITQCLRAVLAKGQLVRLVIWPKLLERLMIAGVHTQAPDGSTQRSPRWGISMNHIARKPDERKADFFTEWKLLKRDSLGRWFDQYCKQATSGHLHSSTISS